MPEPMSDASIWRSKLLDKYREKYREIKELDKIPVADIDLYVKKFKVLNEQLGDIEKEYLLSGGNSENLNFI